MAVLPPIQLQLQVKVGGWMEVSLASLRVRETGWGVIKRGQNRSIDFRHRDHEPTLGIPLSPVVPPAQPVGALFP